MRRVDNLPLCIRPAYFVLSGIVACCAILLLGLLRLTLRVEFMGEGQKNVGKHAIYCYWHENSIAYFLTFLRHPRPSVWLNHPLWYMKPVHQMLWLIGIRKLILGSTGHSGGRAAVELVEYLRAGYSTTIVPDGPAGPPHTMHRGIFYLSAASSVSVLPLKFEMTHYFHLFWTWDKKKVPVPFSKLRIICGRPSVLAGSPTRDEISCLAREL